MSQRLYHIITLVCLSGILMSAHAQTSRGYLSVSTDPSAQSVYVDSVLIGRTPVDAHILTVGHHHIRITHPHRADWYARDYQDEIVIEANETLSVVVPFSGTLHILSDPYNAQVHIVEGLGTPEYFAGTTPLRLPNLDRGTYLISIRFSGYQDIVEQVVVSDAPRTLSVELTPIGSVQMAGTTSVQKNSNRRLHKIFGYTTLGLGAVFTGLALHSSREGNRAYNRYLSTADPTALEQAFQSAARHDTRTTRYVIGAQLNFTATFYFFITHVFRDGKK